MEKVIHDFYENRNREVAGPMEAYMKNNFSYLGIKAPLRKELQKKFLKDVNSKTTIDYEFISNLWKLEEREFQYLALDYLIKAKKSLSAPDIELLKHLITTKSWWDSVDPASAHLVGEVCKKHPELIESHVRNWATDENMWLRRTAILFQLKYKKETKTELLTYVIEQNIQDPEFFIRKAIGWALREYSKVNPTWVKTFINSHSKLSPLSIREGSKYLN